MWGNFLLESVRHAGPVSRTSTTGLKYQTPGAVRPEIVQSSIPKDILIFNLFYSNQERDMELQKFGFKQVYGNFTPSISNWDERIKKIDLVGGAPSSWTATNESNFGKDLVSDFLDCASLLWSSHSINQKDLSDIVAGLMPSVRAGFKAQRIPSADGDVVEPVDISSLYNLPKDSKVFNINMSTIKSGDIQLDKKVFNLVNSEKASGNCAIVVSSVGTGENPFPAKIEGIPINGDVSSLIFLQACALPSGNQDSYFNIPDNFDSSDLLGWYEVVYEDGYKAIVPIQYGVNILEWNTGGAINVDQGK